jgi:hypothetical protein
MLFPLSRNSLISSVQFVVEPNGGSLIFSKRELSAPFQLGFRNQRPSPRAAHETIGMENPERAFF